MSAKVEVILVSRDHIGRTASTLEKISMRFRTARLRALQENPEAFTSTYENESRFEDEVWVKRLLNRQGMTFVAICPDPPEAGKSPGDDTDKLAKNDWRGMIVLLGPRPLTVDGSKLMAGSETPVSTSSTLENQEVVYYAVSMFVLPEVRRQGAGAKLVEASINGVQHKAARLMAKRLNIQLDVQKENKTAIKFYEKCGFKCLPNNQAFEESAPGEKEVIGMYKTIDLC